MHSDPLEQLPANSTIDGRWRSSDPLRLARRCALHVVLLTSLCLGTSSVSHARPDDAIVDTNALAKSKKRKKKRVTPPASTRSPSTQPRTAAPRPPAPVVAPTPAVPSFVLQRHSLQNGLRIVLHPDPTLPSVAVSIAYLAGSSFESNEQQGFSRVVSRHLAADRATKPGASQLPIASSYVGPDLITFTTIVPPGRAGLALWREAHRIARPIDATAFDALRASLEHARRAPARSRVEQLAYQGCWPYEHVASGWTDDLSRSDAETLEAFRRRLIAPSNAVVSVTGRFEPATLLEEIRRLFGRIPPVVASVTPSRALPDQINQRVDLEKSAQPEPQHFLYGWAVPPSGHADLPAIRLAVAMLQDRVHAGLVTRSSRFAKLPDEATLRIHLDERLGPSLLTLRVDLPASLDMDATRAVIDEAMLDLATHGPTAEEMRSAWRAVQSDWLDALSAVDLRASALARAEILRKDASTVSGLPSAIVAINREEVRKAVRVYLTPIRRNLVEKRGPKVQPPAPRAKPSSVPAARKGGTRPNRKKPSRNRGSKRRGSK
jgi:zinc protease